MGRRDEAAQAYREAMKADPRYAQAVGNLASLLEEEGKLTEALEELRRLLALEPEQHRCAPAPGGHPTRSWRTTPRRSSSTGRARRPAVARRRRSRAWPSAYGQRGREDRRRSTATRSSRPLGGEDAGFPPRPRRSPAGTPADSRRRRRRSSATSPTHPEDRRARILLADIPRKQGHAPAGGADAASRCWRPSPTTRRPAAAWRSSTGDLGEPQKAIETHGRA